MLRLYGGYEFTPRVAAVGMWPVERWRFTGRVGVMFMDSQKKS